MLILPLLPSTIRAADREEDEWSLSSRVTAVSDYVSRGLTQTWGRPAIQAEGEVESSRGYYAGLFASNVSRNQYPGGGVEIESWIGYEHEFVDKRAVALELVYDAYPGANYGKGNCSPFPSCPEQSFNTLLARAVARWDWLNARFAYALGDYYGASSSTGYDAGTRGTWYADANADVAFPNDETWRFMAHVGYTRYSASHALPNAAGKANPNYSDWRLGIEKSFKATNGAWRLSLYYTQASNASFYDGTPSLRGNGSFDLGRPTVVVAVDRSF